MIPEIANTQKCDPALCDLFKHSGKWSTIQGQYQVSVVEDTLILMTYESAPYISYPKEFTKEGSSMVSSLSTTSGIHLL